MGFQKTLLNSMLSKSFSYGSLSLSWSSESSNSQQSRYDMTKLMGQKLFDMIFLPAYMTLTDKGLCAFFTVRNFGCIRYNFLCTRRNFKTIFVGPTFGVKIELQDVIWTAQNFEAKSWPFPAFLANQWKQRVARTSGDYGQKGNGWPSGQPWL